MTGFVAVERSRRTEERMAAVAAEELPHPASDRRAHIAQTLNRQEAAQERPARANPTPPSRPSAAETT